MKIIKKEEHYRPFKRQIKRLLKLKIKAYRLQRTNPLEGNAQLVKIYLQFKELIDTAPMLYRLINKLALEKSF